MGYQAVLWQRYHRPAQTRFILRPDANKDCGDATKTSGVEQEGGVVLYNGEEGTGGSAGRKGGSSHTTRQNSRRRRRIGRKREKENNMDAVRGLSIFESFPDQLAMFGFWESPQILCSGTPNHTAQAAQNVTNVAEKAYPAGSPSADPGVPIYTPLS
jgi:hypothetical protein